MSQLIEISAIYFHWLLLLCVFQFLLPISKIYSLYICNVNYIFSTLTVPIRTQYKILSTKYFLKN